MDGAPSSLRETVPDEGQRQPIATPGAELTSRRSPVRVRHRPLKESPLMRGFLPAIRAGSRDRSGYVCISSARVCPIEAVREGP
jgi:hypothetical protein